MGFMFIEYNLRRLINILVKDAFCKYQITRVLRAMSLFKAIICSFSGIFVLTFSVGIHMKNLKFSFDMFIFGKNWEIPMRL
ncbi:MAG: hypothetical protein EA361_00560 [Bacteroidetes bacterium]|nr:MAG: hypothetical protein EA361_00560 [Bacteroidota bacterium]